MHKGKSPKCREWTTKCAIISSVRNSRPMCRAVRLSVQQPLTYNELVSRGICPGRKWAKSIHPRPPGQKQARASTPRRTETVPDLAR